MRFAENLLLPEGKTLISTFVRIRLRFDTSVRIATKDSILLVIWNVTLPHIPVNVPINVVFVQCHLQALRVRLCIVESTKKMVVSIVCRVRNFLRQQNSYIITCGMFTVIRFWTIELICWRKISFRLIEVSCVYSIIGYICNNDFIYFCWFE